ncbi:MAG TPA: PSD1 and planctomycete cytochrome C domain-containing protein [Gemmataceae bacterium]|jgi:hypothetical protein|nr:PSD1 and planctomycete cytochrome C domain-containing protein [Gemmataceae bacterium]
MRLKQLIGTLLALLATAGLSQAGDASFFGRRVAPVLRQCCLKCHTGKRTKGGLDLSARELMVAGGEHGPAVVPGQAARSLLLKMVSGPKPRMPKRGAPLTPRQVANLWRWIDDGAPWPRAVTLADPAQTSPAAEWWSLRPLSRPPVPAVRDRAWPRTPVDAFVLAALEANNLKPAPVADKPTLIRRVTYNLHGLPPTPAEVTAFLHDNSPDAYEKLVDRLLASPRYGERWGRHWLDVVHYGDTHGYDKDKRRDHAWPYRDYVIRSFNDDKPYSRFIKEQLAGDVLYPGQPDGIRATGFIAAGPWDFVGHVELREGTVDKAKARLSDRDDMLSTTVSTFVSLTAHCARCHNHKFDPIPQKDYYRLQAVFAGVDRGDRPYEERQTAERRLAPTRRRKAALEAAPLVYAAVPHAPRPIHLLHRGNVEQPGELVHAGALSAVRGLPFEFALTDPNDEGSRRAALAGWITDPRNVLTWRSIVNRVWHYHYGLGLVDTPNDFGRNGSRPSHPELLDWLAVEFRDSGESIKKLHRLILLSAAYRQASVDNPVFAKTDSENRLLWRMNRRRLEAEEIRDAILAVSGKLDSRMGGPGFEAFAFKDDHSPVYDYSAPDKIDGPQVRRRTVYRFTVRSVPHPFLESLDCADPNINTPVRNTTITALQALALLNDPFILRQAEHLAERLKRTSADPAGQIEAAYRLALGRPPRTEERDALASYARKHGLVNACRLLFNMNEFIFID